MAISLQAEHLKRYRDIARLLWKYGRSDLVRQAGLEGALEDVERNAGAPPPQDAIDLAEDLERLGPTYIKLGQLLSTRSDLVPPAYAEALARLQDRVAPVPFEDVERIVTSELGFRLAKGFSEFEREPLASASLGQVHRAALRDGRPVAVKVQRPNIRERIVDDMDAIEEIATFLDNHSEVGRRYGLAAMVREFRAVLLRELDYRAEAANLRTLGHNLRQFDALFVPQPVLDYTTSRVLTMDFVPGRKITSIGALGRLELDGSVLADQLFRAYLQQILADGFFHADPHPGNVLLTDDGRLALIDLGMVARVPASLQECLVRLLLAVSEGRGPETAAVMIRMGEARAGFDEARFTQGVTEVVNRHQDATVEELDAGRVVVEITRLAGENGLRPPPELSMLGKALLNLDQVARALDPGFRPDEALRRHAAEILRAQLWRNTSQGNLAVTLLEAKEFAEQLPGRVNKLMDALANNEFRLKVDAIDEQELILGIQKVANRVTMGVILASLVIGAAMLMRVPTTFTLLGYPGLAIIFFLVAAFGGIALLLTMLLHDRSHRRRRRDR